MRPVLAFLVFLLFAAGVAQAQTVRFPSVAVGKVRLVTLTGVTACATGGPGKTMSWNSTEPTGRASAPSSRRSAA